MVVRGVFDFFMSIMVFVKVFFLVFFVILPINYRVEKNQEKTMKKVREKWKSCTPADCGECPLQRVCTFMARAEEEAEWKA